jgi:hypothetical protein
LAAVAHRQPPALLVPLAAELGDIGVHLRLQGFGQHPPGTLPDDLVDQRRRALRPAGVLSVGASRNYREQSNTCLRADEIGGRRMILRMCVRASPGFYRMGAEWATNGMKKSRMRPSGILSTGRRIAEMTEGIIAAAVASIAPRSKL